MHATLKLKRRIQKLHNLTKNEFISNMGGGEINESKFDSNEYNRKYGIDVVSLGNGRRNKKQKIGINLC